MTPAAFRPAGAYKNRRHIGLLSKSYFCKQLIKADLSQKRLVGFLFCFDLHFFFIHQSITADYSKGLCRKCQ